MPRNIPTNKLYSILSAQYKQKHGVSKRLFEKTK